MVRLFLALNTVIFGVFGAFAFLNPQVFAEMLGAPSVSSDGLYELCGIYGGVSIGAALLCLTGSARPSMERPALYFLLAYTGGYVLARIGGLAFDGIPSMRLIGYATFEAVTALISIWLLNKRAKH